MIDYEKLKTAQKLCKKLNEYYFRLDFCHIINDDSILIKLIHPLTKTDELFSTLDELIIRLQDLVHLKEAKEAKPKYKINDEVWILDGKHHPTTLEIKGIDFDDGEFIYRDDYDWWRDVELFPTRQALIDSQIEYWVKLLKDSCAHPNKYLQNDNTFDCDDCGMVGIQPDIQRNQPKVDADRCQHESDGICYTSNPPQNICVKCGEFYK